VIDTYKRVFLNLTEVTPTDDDLKNWSDKPAYGGAVARTTANNSSGSETTITMNFLDDVNTDIDTLATFGSKNEVYFIINVWSTAAKWEFKNFKLY